jgi:hypothetical protein
MFLFYGLIWTFYSFSVVVLNTQLGLDKTLGANLVSVSFAVALVTTIAWGSFLSYMDERVCYLKVRGTPRARDSTNCAPSFNSMPV